MEYWEKISTEIKENIVLAVQFAKESVTEETENFDETVIDIPTSLNGSWSARGWTASKGIVSAIAESTSQVLDVTLKVRVCPQCSEWEKKRKMVNVQRWNIWIGSFHMNLNAC